MPTINKSAIVPYSQQQMYDLVNDVEKYHEFVPWCAKSHIISSTEDEIRATLEFSRGGLSKSFSTLNRLQPHKMIEIRLLHGPFRQLEGFWSFEPMDQGSKVSLALEFEFSSRILAMMFGPIFHQVAFTLVESFSSRARQIYGHD